MCDLGADVDVVATNGLALAALLTELRLVGLDLLGVWPIRWSGVPRPEATRRGVAGAFLYGLAFGTALGPCTFAFLGPVIAVTMRVAAVRPLLGMLLMLAYAVGHCGVLALAGVSGPLLARYATWSERSVVVLRGACGALLLGGGLYLIYGAP